MKTIEEIKDEIAVFHSSSVYSNWKELQEDLEFDGLSMEGFMNLVLNAWEQQQVSIAVEKYKVQISLLERDFNYDLQGNGYACAIDDAMQLAPQILEELKGGEGDKVK